VKAAATAEGSAARASATEGATTVEATSAMKSSAATAAMESSAASMATTTALRKRRLGFAEKYKREDCEKNYRKGFLHFSLPPIERLETACGNELR
jgi:hypothetical protein